MGGRKSLKPESVCGSHCGLSPAEGPLRRCVGHASGCPSEGTSVFIYLPHPVHPWLRGAPGVLNPWHFGAALLVVAG